MSGKRASEDPFPSVSDGEMARRIRQKDWSQTPLGSMEQWPQSLRTVVSLCLGSNFPINIIWGPQHTQIYNDGYRDCCGDAHPRALGEDYRITWASAWPAIGASFERAYAGATTYLENQRMFLKRLNGALEETFFTFSHSPIRDEGGGVGGLFHPVTETTATMLAERRTRALRDLSASLAAAADEPEVARRTVEILSRFEFDLPFLLYYALDPNTASYRLTAYRGAEPGRPPTPLSIEPDGGGPWPLGEALRFLRLVEVDNLSSILRGECCGPYEEPPNRAFVLPIVVPAAERPPAIIIVGVSSRLPLTEAYRSFYEFLSMTISGALATVRSREDERRRAEMLAEIDRAKTLFFSNVSHEFRTPLTLILGPLEDALTSGSLPAAERERLAVAHRNSLRLLKLVNSLLDFSRIEAGRTQATYEPVDLAESTAELASNFRSACEQAGLKLEIECPPLPEPVYVDREMWEKIVLNLLSNAFKFTFEGKIDVRMRAVEKGVELVVRDTGVGIPAHELPRMFERFHRIEGQKSRTYEGSGIGLALVQELVKLHNGTIIADSEVGCGTTFTISIPFGTTQLPKERIGAQRSLASTSVRANAYVQEALRWLPDEAALTIDGASEIAQPGDAPEGHQCARVLVADDNADMRVYVRRLLERHCDVRTVADGQAALAAIDERRPDLVLADVMMPRLDGFGLLSHIRADPALCDIPVIMLSARAGEESRVEGLEAGADDYLIKPFSGRELLARVDSNLKLSRLRQESISALRESERRFRTLVQASSDVVYRMSSDWSEMRRLFGRNFIADAENPSRDWMETYIHPDDRQRVLRAIDEAVQNKSKFELEHRLLYADGTMGWAYSRAIPLLDTNGEIIEWFGTASDITARKRAEEVLRESDRRKDEFLAMLAHELRNPLAAIANASEMLVRISSDHPQAGNIIAILKRQVGQLVRLVDDLLDVARISQGRIELRQVVVDLTSIVAQAVEAAQPLMRHHGHRLLVESPHPSISVRGDPVRLVQCVANVLNNAAKYTPDGGQILLRAGAEGGCAKIEVEDNGIGIAADVLPHVFDLFVQGDRALDRSEGGLGIGLSLVKRLVQMHAGSVEAASAGPGHGSTFTLYLPLVEPLTNEATKPAAGGKPRRVLIVDDNRDAADSLALLLELEKHEVETVYSAPAALEAAARLRPDVVLLDIGLPQMDGYEVARRLRRMPELSATRLIALTGYGQTEDKRLAREAGFENHLVKPIDLDKIKRALAHEPESEEGNSADPWSAY